MSSGGSAKLTMIIDFSGIDGSLMIAIAPESMSAEEADLKAKEIFESVRKAYDADYGLYTDGRFDTIQHMRDALEHIGAKIITWDSESYL
jgi:hypothetical protein